MTFPAPKLKSCGFNFSSHLEQYDFFYSKTNKMIILSSVLVGQVFLGQFSFPPSKAGAETSPCQKMGLCGVLLLMPSQV